MMIALDTETTGLDFRHGARPFFVTICQEDNEQLHWEWDVDPEDRVVKWKKGDLEEILDAISNANRIVFQNAKFDITALHFLFHDASMSRAFWKAWDWNKIEDTLMAGHLLASNQPHDLTAMSLHYLGIDIQKHEDELKKVVNKARDVARRHLPSWRIAKKGLSDMPSARDSTWKIDCWLPKALSEHACTLTRTEEKLYPSASRSKRPWYYDYANDLSMAWRSVLPTYANADSAVTLALWKVMDRKLKSQDRCAIHKARMKLVRVIYDMKHWGISTNDERREELYSRFEMESQEFNEACINIAHLYNYDLIMPKGGNNASLRTFVFGPLGVQPGRRSDQTGEPSLDKDALDEFVLRAAPNSKQRRFLTALNGKRKRDTALTYLDGYKRFMVPYLDDDRKLEMCFDKSNFTFADFDGWHKLHPNLNPTGTNTLRFSSSNPNEQNFSKKEGFNLRYAFGPAPGREWWAFDARNIELILAAYEAQDETMIELFERPNDPPYYGSNHIMVFHLLHPDKWQQGLDEVGEEGVGNWCKKKYASTWYQWVKQGNFAVQFGAQDKANGEGTADLAYNVPHAHSKVKEKFWKQEKLSQKYVKMANDLGYVETLPDKTVDPKKGYPILSSRTSWGKVEPTKPFSHHIQGSVGWWMSKAMIRCHEQLREWNEKEGNLYWMIAQVHDELVFDFPKGGNWDKVTRIKELMEMGGSDFECGDIKRMPTPVSISYHPENYSEESPILKKPEKRGDKVNYQNKNRIPVLKRERRMQSGSIR